MKKKTREQQAEFGFTNWGGKRRGAGRKPKSEKAGVSHAKRVKLAERFPVHVTLKVVQGLPNLRRKEAFRELERAFVAGAERFGFRLLRSEPHFVELGWERAQIYLEEVEDAPEPGGRIVGNVRVLVPDVDRYWALAHELGCTVIRPIADRYYGLRDFTIAGPDGVGLRFASRLTS